jgi:DNA-binding CsgD family transcriptional regulator
MSTRQAVEVAQLLICGQFTQREIARQFGVSQMTVFRIKSTTPSATARKRGALDPLQAAALKRLMATGIYTQRDLARKFGVSEATVHKHVWRKYA